MSGSGLIQKQKSGLIFTIVIQDIRTDHTIISTVLIKLGHLLLSLAVYCSRQVHCVGYSSPHYYKLLIVGTVNWEILV